jgi:hypothetical protein
VASLVATLRGLPGDLRLRDLADLAQMLSRAETAGRA